MDVLGIDVIYLILIGVITAILYDWYQMLAWRSKYNIKGPFPLPVIGNLLNMFRYSVIESQERSVKEYGPVSGSAVGGVRSIHVADIEILKTLMVKDHLKFQNRFTMDGVEPRPLDKLLLSLHDADWKRVRSSITPSYSPAKLKQLLPEIQYAAGNLVSALVEKAESREPVDCKYQFGCYTMDVIAGTGFGIRTDANKNPDEPFITLAQKVFGQDATKNPMVLLTLVFPRLGKMLNQVFNINLFYPKDSLAFFINLVKDIISDRNTSETSKKRNDLLQNMLNASHQIDSETGDKKLSQDEILAQSFIIIIAGYETTASLLTFMSYVLATKPEIQDKLLQEVDSVIKEDADVTFDKVMEMPYLDQVMCETLRMYPPVTSMNRMTSENKDVQIDGYWFPKNTMITYSIYQIHHKLGLYEDPDKFIPERFSPEEKQKRDPFTFIPFGHGPRNCIGMRLALLEAKIGLVQILRKLKFVKIPETEENPEFVIHTFLTPKKPLKVGVTTR